MPERERAALFVTHQFIGTQVWDGLTGECITMPTEAYDRTKTAADLLFERLVDHLDWSRVMLAAAGRHIALINAGTHPGNGTGSSRSYTTVGADLGVCGQCVQEALLDDDRRIRWVTADNQPVTSTRNARPDTGQDPAVTLATAVGYRRPGAPQ